MSLLCCAGCDPLTQCIPGNNETTGEESPSRGSCSACPPGYQGTGESVCTPVDYCAIAKDELGFFHCRPPRGCRNILRGIPNGTDLTPQQLFACDACPAGYSDDGEGGCTPCGTDVEFLEGDQSGRLVDASGDSLRFTFKRADAIFLYGYLPTVDNCTLPDGLSFLWEGTHGDATPINITQPNLPKLVLPPKTLRLSRGIAGEGDSSITLTVCVAGTSDEDELCGTTGLSLNVTACVHSPRLPSLPPRSPLHRLFSLRIKDFTEESPHTCFLLLYTAGRPSSACLRAPPRLPATRLSSSPPRAPGTRTTSFWV